MCARSGREVSFQRMGFHRYNAFGRIAHEVISGSFFPSDPLKFYDVPFSCYHMIDPIKEALIVSGFGEIQVSVVQLQRPVTDFSSFRAWQALCSVTR